MSTNGDIIDQTRDVAILRPHTFLLKAATWQGCKGSY